jgi:hypothetical protein
MSSVQSALASRARSQDGLSDAPRNPHSLLTASGNWSTKNFSS